MSERPLVLLSESLPEDWIFELTSATAPELEVHVGLDVDAKSASRVRALLTMLTVTVDDALLGRFEQLRVVSNMAVGFDNIDVQACAQRGVRVGNTPGVLTDATADLAMGLIVAGARGFESARRDAAAGDWGPWSPTAWLGLELRGATLGIVGLGEIGAAVAGRARAFGMRIVYCGPNPKPVADELEAQYLSYDELLSCSDIVSLHCPLDEHTRGLVGAKSFARMRDHAVLVNTARGPVVDTSALFEALRKGQIRGAALDVTDPEPLPHTHPLFSCARCLIVPHLGSATTHTRKAMAQRAVQNILAALNDDRMPSEVMPRS